MSSLNKILNSTSIYQKEEQLIENEKKRLADKVNKNSKAIIDIIRNNPTLLCPYKDEHAIDIGLTIIFLGLTKNYQEDIYDWLLKVMDFSIFLLKERKRYPCNLQAYYELIEHPKNESEGYMEEVTAGSVLYPLIAAVAAVYKFKDIYGLVQKVKSEYLEHCNFQVWYPNRDSEENFYAYKEPHGGVISNVNIKDTSDVFLESIFRECEANQYFSQLSGVVYQSSPYPMILMACRHYRLPVPTHLIRDIVHQ
jgi:hypothetical protein